MNDSCKAFTNKKSNEYEIKLTQDEIKLYSGRFLANFEKIKPIGKYFLFFKNCL